MEALERKLKNEVAKIRMRASERALLRERVQSFMEYHPATYHPIPARKHRSMLSPYAQEYFSVHFTTWKSRAMAAAFMLLLVGTVPLSAESAVPGDVLYPVKVRVNEEVRSSLSLSSYDKVAWEAKRVERRIGEARLLAKEGRLTDEVEEQLAEDMKEHVATAQKEIAEMRESDSDDAVIAQMVMESAFEVQTAVLDTTIGSSTDVASSTGNEEHIKTLAQVVRDTHAALTLSDAELATTSYERFNTEATELITRARSLQENLASSVTAEDNAEIERRIEDINRAITDAQQAYGDGDADRALSALRKTLRDCQKLISFLSDIEVRDAVSVEVLVPKQLTFNERFTTASTTISEIVKARNLIELRRATSTDDALNGKIDAGLAQLDDYAKQWGDTLTEESIDGAEKAAASAKALIEDLLRMTEHIRLPEVYVEPPLPTYMGSTTDETASSSEAQSTSTPETETE